MEAGRARGTMGGGRLEAPEPPEPQKMLTHPNKYPSLQFRTIRLKSCDLSTFQTVFPHSDNTMLWRIKSDGFCEYDHSAHQESFQKLNSGHIPVLFVSKSLNAPSPQLTDALFLLSFPRLTIQFSRAQSCFITD